MTTISDMIKQLEEKASKYDELISDIGELLSKYNANSNPKEELEFENANDYQYEYTCSESSEGRGSRVHRKADSKGRKRKKPCGQKGIHTTKQPITSVSNHQAECKNCGNKPRLNPGNVRLLGWRVV
tara:strand:- start:236 stop:616 length:381 start_codon:yes stop_codon:yes gene_type:complete